MRRSAAVAGIDANARALTITSEHSTLNIGAETTLRFTSNEPISGFAADDIALDPATGVATLSGFTAVSSTVYEATLRADAAGSVTVSVAANKYTLTADGTQNASASNNLAITILEASEAPGITAIPDVAAGEDTFTVSGTTNEADGTVLTVQVGTGQHSVFATVIAASGAWTTEPLSVANLSGSQVIMVTATAPGEGPSAPAQGTVNIAAKPVPANHTAITVLDADATRDSSPAALGVSYTLTPTPADCASAQSANSGISGSAGSVIHHLDHRCDWSVAFTHTAQCQVTVAVRNDATDVATNQTSPIALTKPADPSADSAFTFNSTAANTLAIAVDSAIGNCTSELVIAAQDGTSNISSLNGQNITYTLTPSDCRTDAGAVSAPTPQSRTDAVVVTTINYQHSLDYRCDWAVAFTAAAVANRCFSVQAAYAPPAGGGDLVVHADEDDSLSLTTDPAGNRLVYGSVADAQAVNRLLVSYASEVTTTTITNSYGYEVPYRPCPSSVEFRNHADANGSVHFTLLPKRKEKVGETTVNGQPQDILGSPTDCTPNGRSHNPSGPVTLTAGQSVAYDLDRNCNWNVIFGATDPECRAYTEFYSGNNRLYIRVPEVSEKNTSIATNPLVLEPYILDSRHNATTTFLLKGEGDNIHYSLNQLQETTLPGSRPTITAEYPRVVTGENTMLTMKLTLSHPVEGFTKEDFETTGEGNADGTVANLEKSLTDDTSYTLTLDSDVSGTVTVLVPENSFKTVSGGVQNLAQTPFTWHIIANAVPTPVYTAPADNGMVSGTVKVSGTFANAERTDTVWVTFGPLPQVKATLDADRDTWEAEFDTSGLGVVAPEEAVILTHAVTTSSSNQVTRTVTVDNQHPTVASPIASANVKVGGTVTVPLQTSEAVMDFDDLTDVMVSDTGVATVASISGSGTDYMLTLNGVAAGTAVVSVPADVFTDMAVDKDGAGNNNLAGTNLLTVNVVAEDVTAAPSITAPTANAVEGGMVRVAGKAATANDEVTVSFGSLPSQTVMADTNRDWSATFDTAELGIATTAEVEISATAQASGEASSLPAQIKVTIDKQRPTVIGSAASVQTSSTATVPLKVSEAVTDFDDTADLSVSPSGVATVTSITGSGTDYMVTLTGGASAGTATVSVNPDAFTDTAGNGNVGAELFTVTAFGTAVTDTPVITAPVADGLPAEEPLVVVGTAEPNASVTVSLNSLLDKTVPADGSGSWSAEFENSSLATAADGGEAVILVTAKATGKAVSSTARRTGTVVVTRQSAIIDYPITAISFYGCNHPHGETDETRGVAFTIDGSGYTGGLRYELEVDADDGDDNGCDGYNAVPASFEGEVSPTGTSLAVNRFCHWKVHVLSCEQLLLYGY